jgi:deoxyribodipyrimidine photo-lyase
MACRRWRRLGFRRQRSAALGIVPGMSGGRQLLADFLGRMARYRQQRDFPAVKGVSYLSVHLRFGTVSVRELVAQAIAAGALQGRPKVQLPGLSELVWRDFYFMILDRFPARQSSARSSPRTMPLIWEQRAAGGRGLQPPGARAAPAIRWSMPRCGRLNSYRLHA